jgi:hypothetical protein
MTESIKIMKKNLIINTTFDNNIQKFSFKTKTSFRSQRKLFA